MTDRVGTVEAGRLFAESAYQRPRPRPLGEPLARASDPRPSHEAAKKMRAGNSLLVATIRNRVRTSTVPLSAFDIAQQVEVSWPKRWDEGTIRAAVSRSGLTVVDEKGRSPRGLKVRRYRLGDA